MPLNEKEFTDQLSEAIDLVVSSMAETPEIDPKKFFSMVCMLENLQFFGPIIFSALKNGKK